MTTGGPEAAVITLDREELDEAEPVLLVAAAVTPVVFFAAAVTAVFLAAVVLEPDPVLWAYPSQPATSAVVPAAAIATLRVTRRTIRSPALRSSIRLA